MVELIWCKYCFHVEQTLTNKTMYAGIKFHNAMTQYDHTTYRRASHHFVGQSKKIMLKWPEYYWRMVHQLILLTRYFLSITVTLGMIKAILLVMIELG